MRSDALFVPLTDWEAQSTFGRLKSPVHIIVGCGAGIASRIRRTLFSGSQNSLVGQPGGR